jgi:hypothetical protein
LYVLAEAGLEAMAFIDMPSLTITLEPTVGVVVTLLSVKDVIPPMAAPLATSAELAGATEVKPPNARAATATADTFFNEIVFTIFLSFSQIKDDLLSGW